MTKSGANGVQVRALIAFRTTVRSGVGSTFTNPGMATLDVRLAREIKFSERFRWQLIAEGFNMLNRINITGINSVEYNVRSTVLFPRTDWQTVSSTGTNLTRERQYQIGARFSF